MILLSLSHICISIQANLITLELLGLLIPDPIAAYPRLNTAAFGLLLMQYCQNGYLGTTCEEF
jgi:hypothetical protein